MVTVSSHPPSNSLGVGGRMVVGSAVTIDSIRVRDDVHAVRDDLLINPGRCFIGLSLWKAEGQ